MSLLIRDHIRTAVRSMRVHRSRTLLTTLGIAIGIASVTVILSLAYGIVATINHQVATPDKTIAIIQPGYNDTNLNDTLKSPFSQQKFNTSSLTESDVDAIRNFDTAAKIAPIMTLDGLLRADGRNVTTSIVATSPELIDTADFAVDQGQFIDAITNLQTAVVGNQLAIDLFGTTNPIGQNFTVRNQTFTVIGVLKKADDPINYSNIDFDNAAMISLDAGKTLHEGRTQIQQVVISAPSQQELDTLIQKADTYLSDAHGEHDFTILTGSAIVQPTNNFFVVIASAMTAIAAISLVVGGIGVMNIMLVNVAERTREIGIRKSVGASNLQIIEQFLIESLLISLLGGAIGYISGLAIAFLISTTLYFTISLSWQIAAIAFAVSLGVGIIFGLYPALRAAHKDPIESLRQYR